MHWFSGIKDDLDELIKEYCLKYYEKNKNSYIRKTNTYGCVLALLYDSENNFVKKQEYFDEYLLVACSIRVFRDDSIFITSARYSYRNSGIDINKHIDMFLENLKSGNNQDLCLRWLIEAARQKDDTAKQELLGKTIDKILSVCNPYSIKADILWDLYNETKPQKRKCIIFAYYYIKCGKHEELVKDYIQDIALNDSRLTRPILEKYLTMLEQNELNLLSFLFNTCYRYISSSIETMQISNPISTNNKNYNNIEYYSHFKFIYYLVNMNVNNFDESLKKTFTSYNEFRSNTTLYDKIKSLKIPIFTTLINRIEQLNSYSNTNNRLDKNDIHEITWLLRQNTPRIYKEIKKITEYDEELTDMEISLKDINIFYIFKREKERYEGTSIEEIIEQAEKVLDMIDQNCNSCREKPCRLYNLRKDIDAFLKNRSEENINNILGKFINQQDVNYKCVVKNLWREMLKLKKMLLDRSREIPILGRYNASTDTITLYLGNIYDCKKNEEESDISAENNYKYNVVDVFAHELFHAYHARCIKAEGKTFDIVTDKEKIVVESLASYFENAFANGHSCYSNLVDAWKRNTIYSWPYAGAKHLMVYGGYYSGGVYPNDVLFKFVFKQSIRSLAKAFEMIEFGEKMEFEEF